MDRPFLTIIDEIAEEDEVIRQDIRNAESNPSDPNSWAKLADRLLQKGYYEQSLVCYKKALELEPNNISSWYNRGLALSSIGKYDEAIFCFDEAIKINPNIVYAWNSKGYAFNSQGKFRESIKAYDRVLEIDPNNISAWYNRGLALNNMGSFDEAIQSYDKVLGIDEKNTDALNAKGLALEGLGGFDEAIQSYDRVLEIDEKNTDALNAKGLALERSGKGDDAVQYYDKVTQVYNDRIEENSKNGHFLLDSGKFREAIKAYDRVLEIDPNNISAWYKKGLSLNEIGKYNEAIQSYDKVLEIDSQKTKYTEVLNDKGLALEKLGRLDEAIQSYDKALEIDEKNIDALYNKSNVYHVLGIYQEVEGKSDDALNSYREAVGGLNKIVGLESTNVRALELLRELYSNYIFKYNDALAIDAKLLAIESTPVRKSKFAEDLIKVGKNRKGRQLAYEAKREIPSEQIKRQSCVRLLILSSYLLEGNSIKGNEELVDFLRFYEVLENFKVEEKEWNFNGLFRAINGHSTNPTSKHILTNIIDLLRGKGNREKILSKLLSNVSDSGVQIGHKAYAKVKIIVPIALAALAVVLVAGISFIYFVEEINAEPCTVPYSRSFSEVTGAPTDIAVNPNTNVLYTGDASRKVILAIDCHNREVAERIPTDGIVKEFFVDEKTNIVYADIEDAGKTVALAIDGNTFGVKTFWEKLYDNYIGKVFHFPERKDNSNFSDIKLGRNMTLQDDEWDKERTYLVDDNRSAIYSIGEDNSALSIPMSVLSRSPTSPLKPDDIAFNADTNKFYLATNNNKTTASITVIDATNQSLQKTISGHVSSINSIDVNPKTNKIYLTDPNEQRVSVINGATDIIVKNIPVGRGPGDIFIDDDHNKIYVANTDSNAVSIIDGKTDRVVKVLFFPEKDGRLGFVTANSEKGMVYTGFTRDGRLLINMVNPNSTKWPDHIQVGPTPSYLAFNSNTSKIYITNTQNNSISVLDANKNQSFDDIYLQGKLPSKLVINSNSNKIYVASSGSNNISVIDSREDNVLKDVELPFKVLDIAVNPNEKKIYAIGENNSLSVIDGKNDRLLKNIKLPFTPSAIAVNPNTDKIYLANYNDWSLTVMDGSADNITKGNVIGLKIPPQSLVIDPVANRTYVTSYVSGDASKGDSNVRPLSAASPPLTQIQMINGSNDKPLFNSTLKLDPKYGAVILTSNPNNGDMLAVPLSTDTILSWNLEQAEQSIKNNRGFLYNVKEVAAGADPFQVAFNPNENKTYIANYRLNAILIEDLKKFEAPRPR